MFEGSGPLPTDDVTVAMIEASVHRKLPIDQILVERRSVLLDWWSAADVEIDALWARTYVVFAMSYWEPR